MGLKHTPELDMLFEGILTLKSVDECRALFDDLCTIRELNDMAQRFAVACRLSEGDCYAKISSAIGASSATISRVAKCLNYGADGYHQAIERIEALNSEKETHKSK